MLKLHTLFKTQYPVQRPAYTSLGQIRECRPDVTYMWCGVVLFLSWFIFVCCCFCSCYYSQLSKTDTVGAVLGRCPSFRESNKGSKEKKGPTLGVRFIEVSSYTEVSVKKESTLLISLSCLKYCSNTAQHYSFQIAYLWNIAPFLCQVVQNLPIAIHYKSL